MEYEDLCRLDVLGLKGPAVGDQEQVYNEFKEQLQRGSEGWYQTGQEVPVQTETKGHSQQEKSVNKESLG